MKVLELFAGTRSIGKAFEAKGHKVFSVEWDKKFDHIDLYADILTVTAEQIISMFGKPDVIWASPDCTSYSVAAISRHRRREANGNLTPISEYAKFCDTVNVWGFDCTEKHRADRLEETMIEFNHEFPLLDRNLTKEDAHGMLAALGIKRPLMYDLGYQNNNCIGCVKGGMGYWNKIRVDFPEAFQRMATIEREIGHSCIKGVFLDELEPDRGRIEDEIMQDCGIMCYLAMTEDSK